MERIGFAASKISKGNLLFYNLYVILISSLFAFFIFVITGATVIFALVLIFYLANELLGFTSSEQWPPILSFCLMSLAVLTMAFNLLAIVKNIKLKKD